MSFVRFLVERARADVNGRCDNQMFLLYWRGSYVLAIPNVADYPVIVGGVET